MTSLAEALEAAIRRAEKATPGPWRVSAHSHRESVVLLEYKGRDVWGDEADDEFEEKYGGIIYDEGGHTPEDAAHIASLSPDVAKALYRCALVLDEVARADCGCPWERDEVGDGGRTAHDEDCLLLPLLALGDVLRASTDKETPE